MMSRLIFVGSFAILLFGAYLLFFSQPEQPVTEMEDEPKVTYITLWKANNDIQRGEPVDSKMFDRVQLSLEQAQQYNVSDNIKLPINVGALANQKISAGQWVFAEHISNRNDAGYIDLLSTVGMLLYPIVISTDNLVQHNIHPGDYVDIVSLSTPDTNLADPNSRITNIRKLAIKTIQRNIKVMSLGNDKTDAILPLSKTQDDRLTTIIVEVHPSQIPSLALVQRTTHLEIYPHQAHQLPATDINDVISSLTPTTTLSPEVKVRELRGTFIQSASEVY